MLPSTLGIVSPQEWRSRTSLLLRTRSSTLLKVDEAYENYFKLRSENNKQALHKALHQYLTEKDGNWENVDRNKGSGGLMAYIYNTSKPVTPSNILAKRVPDSRHGVLYLWQDAAVKTEWARIVLEGALGIGSGATGVLEYKKVIAKDSKVSLALEAAKAADGLLYSPKGKADGVPPRVPVEPHPPFIKLNDLRDDPSIIELAKHLFGSLFNEIYECIRCKVKEIWEDVQLKWYSGHMAKTAGAMITALVNFILKKVVEHAAPFVGNAIAIGQGFASGFSAAKDRVSAYHQRRKFIIPAGHPQLIGNAIETQMNWEIGKDIYSMAKGGVSLAANMISCGASSLVDVIAACVEFAYKFLTRFYEGQKMNAWVKDVQAVTRNRVGWRDDPLDGKSRPGIVYDDRAFRNLFERGCEASVCVPMMTLNSGIAGDLMMFVKIFDDTGNILGQSSGVSTDGPSVEAQRKFDAGEKYWSLLKERGRDYLEGTGFQFTSSDKVVQGLMHHAITHHTSALSFKDGALAFLGGSDS